MPAREEEEEEEVAAAVSASLANVMPGLAAA